jgi:hypothetical protein
MINTRYHILTELQKQKVCRLEAVPELELDDPIPETNQRARF